MTVEAAAVVSLFAWLGLFASFIALLSLYWVAGMLGSALFKRMRRIYHLTVILYWLHRLERLGTHKFMRPDPDPNVDSLAAPPTTEEKDQP